MGLVRRFSNQAKSDFPMRVGLVYDLFDAYPWKPGEPADADAEYEPEETVSSIEQALLFAGHEPVRVGTPHQLLDQLSGLHLDAAINIAEGAHSRNREAWAPVLLEMAGIPCLGSDALTLSLTLDKDWTKRMVQSMEVKTPAFRSFSSADDISETHLPGPFPLFVKPRYEGSSKGITLDSKVGSLQALREQVSHINNTYGQDALVESFIGGGGEYTVTLIGHDPVEPLPVLQRAVEAQSGIGLHALERRGYHLDGLTYHLEGSLSESLEKNLNGDAMTIFKGLNCLDFARLDFRVDSTGQAWFLEINPLPTFDPDGSFGILSELQGEPYPEFLAGIFEKGFSRLFNGPR